MACAFRSFSDVFGVIQNLAFIHLNMFFDARIIFVTFWLIMNSFKVHPNSQSCVMNPQVFSKQEVTGILLNVAMTLSCHGLLFSLVQTYRDAVDTKKNIIILDDY